MDFSVPLALAAAVNRLMAIIKPYISNFGKANNWSNQVYDLVLQIIAILIGVVGAFALGGVNVLPATLNVSDTVGVIVTGVLVGLGSDLLNGVLAFLYTNPKQPPAETPSSPTSSGGQAT